MAAVTVQALKAGEPYGRARVRAELTDLNGTAVAGYADGVIVAPLTLTASGSGVAVFELVPNEVITPANTYYTVSVDSHTFLIDVPADGGNMEDLAVDDSQELGASLFTAYEEFLADSQTPYFMQVQNGTGNYFTDIHTTDFIAEASQFLTPPTPAYPLGALADPFIGPGVLADPIGFDPSAPYYTGPGAFRALKTGTLSIQWTLTIADIAGAEGSYVRLVFKGEDGVNQNYADGSSPSTSGPLGPVSATTAQFGGYSILTISEPERLDDVPYSVLYPGYTSPAYPGQLWMDGGMMPLGWDIYPWLTIWNHAVDLTGLTIDHFRILIRKIA